MTSTSSPEATTIISDQDIISGYNRGSITSVFEAPPSCTETITFASSALFLGHWGLNFDQACYPIASNPSATPAPSRGWEAYYYSPALCPADWTTATTFSDIVPIYPSPSAFALGSATTAAICCPSGFSLYLQGHLCRSWITADQVLTLAVYDDQFSSSTLSISTQVSYSYVIGDGVPIMWQATDSAVLERATITTSGQTVEDTTRTSPTTSSTDTVSSNETHAPSPGGLSTGAKVGLGVGIPVAVIALLAIGIFIMKRKRRYRIANEATAQSPGYNVGYEDTPPAQAYELPGHGAAKYGHEYQGAPQYHEMQSNPARTDTRHELPSVSY
ncbi:hypothetical protein GT037_003297 [Alternaria burnsii]|uniref:Mid2 domain-containing protein n=1 Tax=Alternaria burnsii TaxID=1187904 RepID=A0A8H7BDG4_9PLEO|nr:uncharacterized protein GT037_003297 [Alternaria burnsii]KAF7679549.1 hypothetical protein GT037_003297 [Alternaria burnsii]CAI9631341.1 unnamed protein product [Alternaria burnsii]